jgi:hypothetical protein
MHTVPVVGLLLRQQQQLSCTENLEHDAQQQQQLEASSRGLEVNASL